MFHNWQFYSWQDLYNHTLECILCLPREYMEVLKAFNCTSCQILHLISPKINLVIHHTLWSFKMNMKWLTLQAGYYTTISKEQMPICFVTNNVEMLFWKVLITVVLAVVYYSSRKLIRLLSCKSLTISLHFIFRLRSI
jgi:hypothetical protein